MDHQPARAFRNPHPHQQYDKAEHRAGEVSDPPAVVRRKQRGIEQHDGTQCADRGTDPEAAVDDEIGPAAIPRRHQFLNGRVDRSVFAADAGAGEETKQRVARDIPRQRGRGCGREIQRERDEEQLLAADPVGEPAEAERAEHCAGEIGAAGKPDIGVGEAHRGTVLERARQRTRERHFKPVENPGDAERQHDAGVKAAPAEIVETKRDRGLDDAVVARRRWRYRRVSRRRRAQLCPLQCHRIIPMRKAPERSVPRFTLQDCGKPSARHTASTL